MMKHQTFRQISIIAILALLLVTPGFAKRKKAPAAQNPAATAPGSAQQPSSVNSNEYIVGESDVLNITVWNNPQLSGESVVRPDGKISLPLIGEIKVAGLTPKQIQDRVAAGYKTFIADPRVNVGLVRTDSKEVYVIGAVQKPGSYSLSTPMTVIQLIAKAGGLVMYSSGKHILIMRTQNGNQTQFHFSYKDFMRGKNPGNNIQLQPGDTVLVR